MLELGEISELVAYLVALLAPLLVLWLWFVYMARDRPRPLRSAVETASEFVSRWALWLLFVLVLLAGTLEVIDRLKWWGAAALGGPSAVAGSLALLAKLFREHRHSDHMKVHQCDTGANFLRLYPREFIAEPSCPFKYDLLGRRPHVESLSGIIQEIRGHSVLMVDAPWGSGKTAFVKMCSAHLEAQEIRVVEFNAWKQSYTKDPLSDLVAAISESFGPDAEDLLKALDRLTNHAARHAIRTATRGFVEPEAARKPRPRRISDAVDINEAVEDFKSALSRLAERNAGPLVVVVDELDRCRPSYALDLLEVLRHLLAIEGVVVVTATNRAELCHSIKRQFGSGFGADRYLRRFADLVITLPPPEEPDLYKFFDSLLDETGLGTRFKAIDHNPCPGMLRLIVDAENSSFRDLEQAIQHSAVVLASLPHPSALDDPTVRFSERLAVAMIVLRALDKDSYQVMMHKGSDMFQAAAALSKTLGQDPESLNDISAIQEGQLDLEVSLFAELKGFFLLPENNGHDKFVRDYDSAFLKQYPQPGNLSTVPGALYGDRARHVANAARNLYESGGEGPKSILDIRRLIEVIDYNPDN